MPSKKKKSLSNKPAEYIIYGIFNFEQGKLVYINLDLDKVELEFDISGYEEEEFSIVEFKVMLVQ